MPKDGYRAQVGMLAQHDSEVHSIAGALEDRENELESNDVLVVMNNDTFWALKNAWDCYKLMMKEAKEI